MTANRIVVSLINGRKDVAFGPTIIVNCFNIRWKEVRESELKSQLDLLLNSHDIIETHVLEFAFFVYLLDGIQRLCDTSSWVRSMEVVSFELVHSVSQ